MDQRMAYISIALSKSKSTSVVMIVRHLLFLVSLMQNNVTGVPLKPDALSEYCAKFFVGNLRRSAVMVALKIAAEYKHFVCSELRDAIWSDSLVCHNIVFLMFRKVTNVFEDWK